MHFLSSCQLLHGAERPGGRFGSEIPLGSACLLHSYSLMFIITRFINSPKNASSPLGSGSSILSLRNSYPHFPFGLVFWSSKERESGWVDVDVSLMEIRYFSVFLKGAVSVQQGNAIRCHLSKHMTVLYWQSWVPKKVFTIDLSAFRHFCWENDSFWSL